MGSLDQPGIEPHGKPDANFGGHGGLMVFQDRINDHAHDLSVQTRHGQQTVIELMERSLADATKARKKVISLAHLVHLALNCEEEEQRNIIGRGHPPL